MIFRTDLALEAAADLPDLPENDLFQRTDTAEGMSLHRLCVRTDTAARRLDKPRGTYITATFPCLSDDEKQLCPHAIRLGRELAALLPPEGCVLVVGLGNRTVTPDTLGPATADRVLATRHIGGEFARAAGLTDLRPVAVLAPGVLGQTGTESGEIVAGVCRQIAPAAVVAVDALAALSPDRLGCTVQLCDSGIAPGSGVGNNRQPLSRASLGVPVIGLGVPTVVDAAAFGGQAQEGPPMMVTPREIDLVVSRAARLLAMTVNAALQPDYDPAQLMQVALGL